MKTNIEKRVRLDIIRYANCWEDADILLEALAPLEKAKCLSIASAGDNAFALLAGSPEQVVALDISVPQLACVELKAACFRMLEWEEMLAFLGVRKSYEPRIDLYKKKLRPNLGEGAREYWDRTPRAIDQGIIFQGKFENYFRLFRKYVVRFIHSKKTVKRMTEQETSERQKEFYDAEWNTWRWRVLFKLFFNRRVMGSAGRDPEFFKYVEQRVSRHIFERVQMALRDIPGKGNPYLQFILYGNFTGALPFYLREENYHAIKQNLEALHIYNGNTSDAIRHFGGKWDAFNLSDIFEYMPLEIFEPVAAELIEHAAPEARFAYWNMMVPRDMAQTFPEKVNRDDAFSDALFRRDKAFFYQAFHVNKKRIHGS